MIVGLLLLSMAAVAPQDKIMPMTVCEVSASASVNVSVEIEAVFLTDGYHGMVLIDDACPRDALAPVMSMSGGEGEVSDPLIRAFWRGRMEGRSPLFRIRARGHLQDAGETRPRRFVVEEIHDFIELQK